MEALQEKQNETEKNFPAAVVARRKINLHKHIKKKQNKIKKLKLTEEKSWIAKWYAYDLTSLAFFSHMCLPFR